MAKIFLDANIFIDLVERRGILTPQDLHGDQIMISPLSVHILMYVAKKKVPDQQLEIILQSVSVIGLEESILHKSLEGPTNDFEDNVQLHSAAEAECDLFLTNDKQLLSMKFFGKTEIVPALP